MLRLSQTQKMHLQKSLQAYQQLVEIEINFLETWGDTYRIKKTVQKRLLKNQKTTLKAILTIHKNLKQTK